MSDVTIPERPADIPQDVWLDTGMEFDKLYDAEPDLEGGCEWAIRQMAARMVLAETERCAKIADGCDLDPEYAEFVAQAIRSSHE